MILAFSRPIAVILLGIYAVLNIYASLRAAQREGWDLLPALPVTFAAYQSAYAIGFFAGLLYWFTRHGRDRQNTG
jgi:hypothetical protein